MMMIQLCCATCRYYDGVCCTKKVKGWLAKDAATYFCKLWDEKEAREDAERRENQ